MGSKHLIKSLNKVLLELSVFSGDGYCVNSIGIPLQTWEIFRQSTRQHQGFTVTNCCFLLLGLSGMDNFNKPRSTIGKMCLVMR